LSVSEPQRLALHRAARAALGEEEGDTLMALSPPSNTDMATRQDVERAQAIMSAQLAEVKGGLKAEIAQVKGGLKAEIAQVKGELKAEIAQVKGDLAAAKGELTAEIAQVKGDLAAAKGELTAEIERMGSRTLRWTVVTMLTGNAAVIGILGFLIR
jgi:uncharacterized protein involved in exopolysaccharide biosynthesis